MWTTSNQLTPMPVALHCHTNNWGQCNLRYKVVVDTSTFSLSGIGFYLFLIYLVSLGISLWFKQDLDVDNRQKTYITYTFFLDNCFLSFIMILFFISISSRKTIMVLWTAIRASALTISIWKCLKCFSAQPHSADSHSGPGTCDVYLYVTRPRPIPRLLCQSRSRVASAIVVMSAVLLISLETQTLNL